MLCGTGTREMIRAMGNDARWKALATQAGRRLGLCSNRRSFERQLDEIVWEIDQLGSVPEGFWDDVYRSYESAPKPLYEESSAAEALNALIATAKALIATRTGTGQ